MFAKTAVPSPALVVALIYSLIGIAYILSSDHLLELFTRDVAEYRRLQTFKGWAFIAVTAIGLWVTLRATWARLERSFAEVQRTQDQLRASLDAAEGCSWQTVRGDAGDIEILVEGRLAQTLGLPERQPMPFRLLRDRVPAADLDAVDAHWHAIAQEADDIPDAVLRLADGQGGFRWVRIAADLHSRSKGPAGGLSGVAFDITDLQDTTQRLVDVIEGGELGTWRHDRRTGALTVNDRWLRMLGYGPDELRPTRFQDWQALVHPDDLAMLDKNDSQRFVRPRSFYTDEFRMRHKDGHWVWIASRGCAVETAPSGEALVLSGVNIDISARKALEAEVLAKSDFLMRLTETSVSGVLVIEDTGRIVFSNLEAQRILDGSGQGLIGQRQDDLPWMALPEPLEGAAPGIPLREILETGRVVRDLRLGLATADGSIRTVSVNAAPMGDAKHGEATETGREAASPQQVVCSVSDISRQIEAERSLALAAEEARHAARHDALTGLPNRAFFRRSVEAALARRQPADGPLAQVFLSIDQFQEIKDRFGPIIGDEVILRVAERLEGVRQAGQVLARVGAEEFTLLHPCTANGASVEDVINCLARAFDAPFDLEGQSVYLHVSLGTSLCPADAQSGDEMWINADLAMYEAKSLGGNRCMPFSTRLRERMARTNLIGQSLQRAIQDRAFQLFLQPKVDLQNGNRLIGAEALVRSTEPNLADLGPAEFMPIAEKTGLIGQIDLLVLDMAGDFLSRLQGQATGFKVSVNVSAESLRQITLTRNLLARLDAAGLGPDRVLFELTEGAMVDIGSDAQDSIELLLARGFELSVDDFGTGYSSLSYLQRLRLTELKIDRSFVTRLGSEEGASDAIVRATLAMADALGIRTVAEGIDSTAQMEWLRDQGCAIGQGYLFGKPMLADDFARRFLNTSA